MPDVRGEIVAKHLKTAGLIAGALLAIALVVIGGLWLALRRADVPYEKLEQTYANAESEFVDLSGGVRMHFRDEGKFDGPVIVLVHGFSASLHTWEPWVEALKADHRVISIDLPGHGLTRAPKDYAVSMDGFVAAIESFAETRRLDRFVLVGQSMGGDVAWRYARAHPERLSGMVLLSSAGWPQEGDSEFDDGSLFFALLEKPWGRPLVRDLDASATIRRGVTLSYADKSLATDETIERYVRLGRAPGHRDIVIDLLLGFSERTPATEEALAAVRVPTLILHGDKDALIPVADARKFDAALPVSNLIVYPGAGHLLNEEIPERSTADLRAFIAALEPQAQGRVRGRLDRPYTGPAEGSPYFFQ